MRRVLCCLQLIEYLPDQWKGRKCIDVLMIPVVQEGIHGHCHWIPKWGDEVRQPEVKPCSEQVHRGVAPQLPQATADLLMQRPFCGEYLVQLAETVCQDIGGPSHEPG